MSTRPGANPPRHPVSLLPYIRKERDVRFLAVVLLLFSLGCTPSAEELISDLLDYEEGSYECYNDGNAQLPVGTHPSYLIGLWECEGGTTDQLQFYPDGRFREAGSFPEFLEYWYDCGGNPAERGGPSSEYLWLKGNWVVDGTNRLCVRLDDVQSGLYNCQEITYESGTLTGSGCADYYDSDGSYLGRECDEDDGLETCTLEQE